MKVGLRVDVDTYRGTRAGLPRLLETLDACGIRASFFFSVGPDNMGRHLWRLVRKDFLVKMLRSRAPRLYGWDILFAGTFWPGRRISRPLASCIARVRSDGHEIGLHAWDHHKWQRHIERMDPARISSEIERGRLALGALTGEEPRCFAAPGWRCTEGVLAAEESLGFRYASDCRGRCIFVPVLAGRRLVVPQIPVTLPTYDEVIGRGGIDDATYNEYLLSLLEDGELNVLAVHAEVEGMRLRTLFEDFLRKSLAMGVSFDTLGSLLPADVSSLPSGRVTQGFVPGREGWVAVQGEEAGDP